MPTEVPAFHSPHPPVDTHHHPKPRWMHVGGQKTPRHHGGASGPANHKVLGIKPEHPHFFGTFCHYVIFTLKHQTGIHTFFPYGLFGCATDRSVC